MSYYDDRNDEHDDDIYYEKEYDDIYPEDDKDEEDSGSSDSNIRNKINRFGATGNLPGRGAASRSSGITGSSSGSGSSSSSSSPFYQSRSGSSGSGSSGGVGSRDDSRRTSSPIDRSSSPIDRSNYGRDRDTSGSRSTYGTSSSGRSSYTGSSSSSSSSPIGSSSSRTSSGISSRDSATTKGDKSKSDKDKKSDGGSNPLSNVTERFSGLTSRFRGGDKSDSKDKKPDKTKSDTKSERSNPLNSVRGMLNRSGGDDKKSTTKPDRAKKSGDDKSSGGLIGNLRSRIPFGGGDDKKDSDKSSSSSVGGTTSRGGIGGSSGVGRSPIGRSSTSTSSSDSGQSRARSSMSGFGRARAQMDDSSSAKSSKADTSKSDSGGGLFGRVAASIPFVGSSDSDKKSGVASKTRKAAEKAPQITNEGMSLDTKLDILGVVLVFGALMLFFSALSSDQGALTGQINSTFSKLFGWGAIAVPLSMFAVGIWLIIRHFGENAPTIELQRIVGIGMLFVGLLILFQYLETFNPVYDGDVEFFRYYVRETGRGGGAIGTELYLFIVDNIGELGGIFVVTGWFVISIMFITMTSAAELAVIIISVWRSFQIARQRRAQRRAAMALLEQQKANNEGISISQPSAGELTGGSGGALPAPQSEQLPLPIEQRSIPIRMGGQMLSTSPDEAQPPATQPPKHLQTEKESSDSGGIGGLFAGIAGSLPLFNRGSSDKDDEKEKSGGFMPRVGSSVQSAEPAGTQASQTSAPNMAPPPPASTPSTQSNMAANTAAPQATPTTPEAPTATPAGYGVNKPSTSQNVATDNTNISDAPPAKPFTDTSGILGSDGDDAMEEAEEANRILSRTDRLNQLRSGMTRAQDSEPIKTSSEHETSKQVTPENGAKETAQTKNGQQGMKPTPVTNGQETSQPNPSIKLPERPQQSTAPTAPSNRAPKINWRVPEFLNVLSSGSEQDFDREALVRKARIIEETLQSFGAPGRVVEINTGPVITQFGVEPDYLVGRNNKKSRVKVGSIAQLDKDLQLALGAKAIRIEAPVPGKGFVGVEVPNDEASLVSLRDVMESREFQRIKSPLAIALGQSVDGAPVAADLTAMPHLLIAGTTGSGKSVCVNSIIASILLRNTPNEVKLIMVDPKRVELTGYNGIPHLVAPVVVELERIVGVLKWVTREMDDRYKKFSDRGARNIVDYNQHLQPGDERMPYIVVIIDELADLMMLAPDETERTITRIAALARATGIHLVIATQRPSVDVVTGLIKANFPARVAFAVAGGVDSRVILDQPGAERLLGKGDMLYMSGNSPAPLRLQGVFVSDLEISNMVRYWRAQASDAPARPIPTLVMDESSIPVKTEKTEDNKPKVQQAFWDSERTFNGNSKADEELSSGAYGQEDELYEEAVELVRRLNKASISLLQRRLRIGYTRASRLIDVMEQRGVVGPATEGSKPRMVLPVK